MNDWRGLQVALAADNGWQSAYAYVEETVRERLSDPDTVARLHLEADTLSTTALVELLWPEQFAKGDGITARKRLYKALKALATRGLADCAERGVSEERVIGGVKRFARPWRWHAPRAVKVDILTHTPEEARVTTWDWGVIMEALDLARRPSDLSRQSEDLQRNAETLFGRLKRDA